MLFLKKLIGIVYTAAHILYVPYLVWKSKKGQTAILRDFTSKKAIVWGKRIYRIFNAEVIVEGHENIPNEPVVIMSNHQSMLDIPLLFGYMTNKPSFIGKKELKKMPVIGIWMRYLNCFFLDRSNPRSALASFKECGQWIKSGQSVIIFPEGTRSKELMEFKRGSFKLPFMAGVPILPVTIVGSDTVVTPGKKSIKLIIHPPVKTANSTKEEQEQIINQVEETIKGCFLKQR